jgi:predicted ATPase
VELGVLGPLQVTADDGTALPIANRTQRVVLASLLAKVGDEVPAAALLDAAWDGAPPPEALDSLRSEVASLVAVLGDRVVPSPDGWALRLHGSGVDGVDAWRFEQALRRMRTDPGPTSQALLAAELGAWRGAAFGELAELATVRAEARRLELARAEATALLAGRPAMPRRPLTPTVGRAGELAATLSALEQARLVTIVGPGGVGKTRLAGDVAALRADAHGAVVVELARVDDAAGVAATVAAALDLRPTPGGELAALTGLGGLDRLVVLDNCEHVIDAVVHLVPGLLHGGDRLCILTTSREALAIEGEHVIALGPLSTVGPDAPAITLFRQRAGAAAPAGGLDEALVADLVERLDGLPLALEMAAARLRTMSLLELTTSIADDVDALATSRRDVDARHRTLRELLAWSERLLDDELRDALHACAVFAGPVAAGDLGAAIATPRPADTIGRLVDRSLVLARASDRGTEFSLLSTVRSYGRQRLEEEGRLAAIHRRHAEWFHDAVAEIDARLRTVDEPAALARFIDIFDEVRTAVRWAQDVDPDLAAALVVRSFAAGRIVLRSEVAAWAADVAGRLPGDHPSADAVRGALADGLSATGRLEDAIRVGEDVLDRAPASRSALLALEGLADAALYQGRLEDAAALSGRLREVAASVDDGYYLDIGTIGLALATAYQGRVDEALDVLADGPTCPAPTAVAWFEYARGESILDRDPTRALAHLERALDVARRAGDRYVTEVALLSSSSLRARTGELDGAVARFTELLDHFRVGGDEGHLVTSLRNLVTLLVRLGQYRAATALFGAVREHASSPTYGVEAERLGSAATECQAALGDEEFERVVEVGRARPFEVVVAAAAATLRNVGPAVLARRGAHVTGTVSVP